MTLRAPDYVRIASTLRPRIVYVDLDGTLLGPGGSLVAKGGGGTTTRGAAALAGLREADVAAIPLSGRTEDQVVEAARVLGADGFIAELGGVIGREGRVERRRGAAAPGRPPREQILRSGAAGVLLERFAGRLEPHAPWAHQERWSTILLRGEVDLEEARAVLMATGYAWLDLVDNGLIARSYPTLRVRFLHAYHLAPRGITKHEGARHDLAARGLEPEEAIAIGDSLSDLEVGRTVGAVFVVANGEPAVRDAPHPANGYLTEGSYGDGVAEVVDGLLGLGRR